MRKEIAVFNELVKELLEDEKLNSTSEYIPAKDLFNRLDLSLSEEPIDEERFFSVVKELILKTPKTSTNTFFNQLFGGRNSKAVLGDLLAVMLNNSMYTYKAAGPQVGVEKVIIDASNRIINYGDKAGGTFASGGSLTNFMAMLMARDSINPDGVNTGVSNKMTVYTSTDSHYSIPKNASFSGIGKDNVRYITTDDKGKMIVSELDNTIATDIENGFTPVLVNITAGTTVLGAFDSVKEIIDSCKKYNVWLHLDGAYCGSVMFSKKHKHLIEGVNQVDSFSYNAHKMIGAPLTCSILLVKDKTQLYQSFANDASYLYQTENDDFNLGKTSLQCGRRNDALKFWTLWKSAGTRGLEKIVDHQFYLADIAREYIRKNSDYQLYSFDNSISVCFNYKGISARKICTLLYEKAQLMVGYGAFKNEEFIRLVTINAHNSKEDILNFFKILEDFAEENALDLSDGAII